MFIIVCKELFVPNSYFSFKVSLTIDFIQKWRTRGEVWVPIYMEARFGRPSFEVSTMLVGLSMEIIIYMSILVSQGNFKEKGITLLRGPVAGPRLILPLQKC